MRLSRIPGGPLRRVLDTRVRWLIAALDDRLGSRGRPSVHGRLDDVHREIDRTRHEVDHLRAAVDELRGAIVAEGRAAAEGTAAVLERLREVDRALEDVSADYQIPPLDQRTVDRLRWPVVEFVNWATYQHGYAGQAGLWMNNPVMTTLEPGRVSVSLVNERIVEVPFAFAALAGLARPSRILDVGGAESTLGLSLASLGHDVTLVDPRGFAVAHPRLTVRAIPIEHLPPDDGEYDAALAVSSIEHIGLRAYGVPGTDASGDIDALRFVRGRLRPGGTLVLTVPFGPPSRDDFQRVYDDTALDELLGGWDVAERVIVRGSSPTVWARDAPEDGDRRGVALVRARRPTG